MRLKSKTLGLAGMLAVVAMLVMAVGASAASAAEFKAETYPVIVKSESTTSNNVFSVGSTEVACSTADLKSVEQLNEPSNEITMHPTYENCTAFAIAGATVKTEGCNYELFTNGEVNVACASGDEIKIEAAGCVVSVPPQSGLTSVSYENIVSPPEEVEVTDNVNKISYGTNGSFLCPAEGQEATYSGTNRAKGYNASGEQVGIKVS